MRYVSTRGSAPVLDFAEVTLAGLASDAARYITGQSLYIDGGSHLLGLPQFHSAGTSFSS